MPLILPGNVATATASTTYNVANSCRFDRGSNPTMSKTQSAGDRDKWTFSCWFKLGATYGTIRYILGAKTDGTNYVTIEMDATDKLRFGVLIGGSYDSFKKSNRVFKDTSAWTHLVCVYDSENGTAGLRQKVYINGVEETSWASDTTTTQNQDSAVNDSNSSLIVGNLDGESAWWDGYLAEVCLVDGSALAPTSFGEFDEDSPNIWKPIDVSGLSFGTNGFYLDFEASGNLGNDANGGTDLTEANIAATDQSTDTPTLNYPTLSPLVLGSHATLTQGNLHLNGNTASDSGACYATIPFPKSGKWYIEEKMTDAVGQFPQSGIQNDAETSAFQSNLNNSTGIPSKTNGSSINCSGNIMVDGSSAHSISAITDGQIKQFAIDMDNGAVYFGLNNTWYNSGDPESGGSRTGAIDTWTAGTRLSTVYGTTGYNGSDSETNFGSPSYANSSDAADADGSGAFEYAPPSGYFALNSKNIGEYGG